MYLKRIEATLDSFANTQLVCLGGGMSVGAFGSGNPIAPVVILVRWTRPGSFPYHYTHPSLPLTYSCQSLLSFTRNLKNTFRANGIAVFLVFLHTPRGWGTFASSLWFGWVLQLLISITLTGLPGVFMEPSPHLADSSYPASVFSSEMKCSFYWHTFSWKPWVI